MTTPNGIPGLTGHGQYQYLAKVLDVDGYWAGWSGGEFTINVTEQRDGGADVPDLIPGRGTHTNVVLRRPFKPERDMDVIAELEQKAPLGFFKVLVLQPIDHNKRAYGKKFTCPGSLLVRVGAPQYDEESETGSSYEIEWRVPKRLVQ